MKVVIRFDTKKENLDGQETNQNYLFDRKLIEDNFLINFLNK